MSQIIRYYEERDYNGARHCRTSPNSRFWFIMLSEEQAEKEYSRLLPNKYLMVKDGEPESWNKLLCYEFEQQMLNEKELDEAVPQPREDITTDTPSREDGSRP